MAATGSLVGRRALITGGASGIGRACAVRLAEAGADGRRGRPRRRGGEGRRRARSAAPRSPSTCPTSTPVDALDLAVDILVNNAGLQHVAPLHEFPVDRFSYILRLMLEAPFRLVRGALPHMYERGWGRVVNISSVHGLRASAFKSAYVTAKHGLEGLSKVIALEGAEHGVTSNCVNPAYVRTPLVEGQIADQAKAHGLSEDEVVEQVMLAPGGGQAADRAGGGRRGGGLPLLARRGLGHRHLPGHGRRVERPLSAATGLTPTARQLAAGPCRAAGAGAGRAAEYFELLLEDAAAIEYERPLVRARAGGCRRRRAGRAGAGQAARPAGPRGLRGPAPPRVGALGAVRHRQRPRRAARRRLGAHRDRPPGPPAARHRRLVPDPQRRRPRRHLHAGHRRLGLRPLPGAAAADGRGARRAGRPDGRAVRDGELLRRRPLPAHRARSTTACTTRGSSRSSACR